MMAILFAALGKSGVVNVIAVSAEHSSASAVLRHTIAPQIRQVRAERRALGAMPHDARFDGDVARPIAHHPDCGDARWPAAPEGAATARASRSQVNPAGLLSRDQRLSDERLCAPGAASTIVPDPPEPDAQIIIACHGCGREVSVNKELQALVPIEKLSCAIAPRTRPLTLQLSCAFRPGRTSRLLSCPGRFGSPSLSTLIVKHTKALDILRTTIERRMTASA
jgi:hypothetical protein